MLNKYWKSFLQFSAKYVASVLTAVLFICANTNSSCMYHQLEEPNELQRFCKSK